MPKLRSRKSLRKGKKTNPICDERKWRVRMLVRASGGLCRYCAKPVAREDITIDHVVPLSQGGLDVAENLALSCMSCNQEKGSGVAIDLYIQKGGRDG